MGLSHTEYLNERGEAQDNVFRIKQELYALYLSSPEWQKKRSVILERDKTCRLCKEQRSTQVHHVTYASVFRESRYDLIGLCEPCHERLHLLGIPTWGNLSDFS
jgi:5-methylcytosine-specific restriction endonuclease McrA